MSWWTTTLRHADFRLDDTQQMVSDTFAALLEERCQPERVRAAEVSGVDLGLWRELQALRPVAMSIAEDRGGDGAGLVEAVLGAEQVGRRLAPIPYVEAIAAARLLAEGDGGGALPWIDEVLAGDRIVVPALHPGRPGCSQLVPYVAAADGVLGLCGDELVVITVEEPPERVANQACSALGWFDLVAARGERIVLASGPEAVRAFERLGREWKLMMAGALTGVARASLDIAVEHATSRVAFGVPIGSFQAVAHPLVDVAMAAEGAERMVRKAAWWADVEPEKKRYLVPMAYLAAAEAASLATRVGVHTLGGVGFTVESDVEMYFRRAKGWPLVAGDPQRELDAIADVLCAADALGDVEVAG